MTGKYARLTPASQDQRGWLWNDYPLESKDWEIELALEVKSTPHYGGDGFGVWVLSGDHDPMYHWEPDYLNGAVFGLREDFRGFGVIFDTYDNDGNRDNPSVFVVSNFEGRLLYDHENDFTSTMINIPSERSLAYKCYSNYRNSRMPFKTLIRYQEGILHVYVMDGTKAAQKRKDYKYCLSVRIDLPVSFQERHLAFTAMTGQVADKVDILEITTRYLDETDAVISDVDLDRAKGHSISHWSMLFWIVIFGGAVLLVLWTLRDISYVRQTSSAQANVVYLANSLNSVAIYKIGIYFGVCGLLLLTLNWTGLLLNLPFFAFQVYSFLTKAYLIDPAELSGGGRKKNRLLSISMQLYVSLAFFVITAFYYFLCVLDA